MSLNPDSRRYLYTIQHSAVLLQDYLSGKTFADYHVDSMLRDAVERNLITIGEAINQLSRADAPTAAQITGFQDIVGLRNILVHGYESVDDETVWNILDADLPLLAQEVDSLLQGV